MDLKLCVQHLFECFLVINFMFPSLVPSNAILGLEFSKEVHLPYCQPPLLDVIQEDNEVSCIS